MIYFKPQGVAEQGEQVVFTAYADRTEHSEVILRILSDDGNFKRIEKMKWIELNERGEDVYVFSLDTKNLSGLYWYDAGEEVYQLSVCKKRITHPSWYAEGVTYHIFVDRFNRKGDELRGDTDFYVHIQKEELPHWESDRINYDIYGGNLNGICEKLSYLNSLGVKTIYLSPIFEAWSNHKYNTANFNKIDEHFGSEEDFRNLCKSAEEYGMKIILDGVFNHVGSDSIYFNKNNRYKTLGAYQGEASEYYKWFSFTGDNKYDSWWGIDTLPAINETEESYKNYISHILKKWLKNGASGWRLDVVDELPDEFVLLINQAIKEEKTDALIIGEVWEDASNKIAYSVRRKYFTEPQLDGVMNYPLREAIILFVTGKISASDTAKTMNTLALHYPKEVLNCLMNHIGTHDTPRILSVLARPDISCKSRAEQAKIKLDLDATKKAVTLLKKASVLQYAYPGSPCIYYGDEVGAQGGADPFNRAYFPWGKENEEVLKHYRDLGYLKTNLKALKYGDFSAKAQGESIILLRRFEDEKVIIIVSNEKIKVCIDIENDLYDVFTGEKYRAHFGKCIIDIPECGYLILKTGGE